MGATWLKRSKELLLEITIIVVAASLVILLWKVFDHYVTARSKTSIHRPALAVGSRLAIPGIDFSRSPVSLILVSSPTCPYCLASKTFHAKIIREAKQSDVPFLVAVPSRESAGQYLREIGVAESSVTEWKEFNLRADATPTIVAVDSSGTIRSTWVGVLPPFDESELLKAIQVRSIPSPPQSSGKLDGVPNYSSEDLNRLRARDTVRILDTHERGYPGIRSDAVLMPLLEARYRARFELNQNELQVVDCSNLSLSQCENSVQQFTEAGFRIATLNAGQHRETCKATAIN